MVLQAINMHAYSVSAILKMGSLKCNLLFFWWFKKNYMHLLFLGHAEQLSTDSTSNVCTDNQP